MLERIRSAGRSPSALAAIGGLVALVIVLAIVPAFRPTALLRDFSAFYCAGAAIDANANPYLEEPIGTCERAPKPAGLNRGIPGLAVPAPLPPLALGGFALLARLPYAIAALLWTALLTFAVIATVGAMRRLGVCWIAAFAALALTDGFASLALGQIAPLAIAGIVLAAEALERDRPAVAGAFAAIALIEPHLGLPSLAAIAVARPGSRAAIAVAGACFVAGSLLVLGGPECFQYLQDVLPAHARSEIASTRQLSLTVILAEFGVPPATALSLGELAYALTALLGIVVGIRLALQRGPSLIALAPAAFAVTGGPFVHIVQLAAATPLALVLLYRETRAGTPRAWRVALETGTIALAVPWVQFASLGDVLVPLAAWATAALSFTFRPAVRIAGISALAAIALLLAIAALATDVPADQSATLVAHADPHALAEASWSRYVDGVGGADRIAYDLARLPTWLGALAVVTTATALAFRGKGSRGERRISSPS